MTRLITPLFLFLVFLFAVACSDTPASQPAATPGRGDSGTAAVDAPSAATLPTAAPDVLPTSTPVPPTPTQEPLAATVNGQPVYLATFEETLARYEQGQALLLSSGGQVEEGQENHRIQVLDMLIERSLIEQAAAANGIEITPEMVEQQMAELRQVAEEAGGAGSFEAWLQANQWTEESFREALAFEMLTEQVSASVTSDVPEAVKQVHARYIQVEDEALAQSLSEQLAAGADFGALAQQYSLDRATGEDGGDLGYFAAGTLLVPEVESAAFSLEPGEVSDVISGTSLNGSEPVYYLVQVVDVDPQRPLSPDLRALLLQERFEAWLAQQWQQAEIVRFIETGA